MRRFRPGVFILLLLALLLLAPPLWAHRGHWHGHRHTHARIVIGVPLAGWVWQQPPVLAYPPALAMPGAPTYYIEQSPPASPQASWWYYCPDSRMYYPYVTECPRGWQRVAPQPPDLH